MSWGPHQGGLRRSCRARMQAPSSQKRQEGGMVASSTLCAWPGVVPPLTPASPGPTLTQGSSRLLTLGFWGSGPAPRCVRPSCLRSPPPHMAWHLPASVTGPSPSPSPAEPVALQTEQLRQAGRAVGRPWAEGQTHLRDDLASSLCLSFPSVMHPAQCLGPGSSSFSGLYCSLAACGFWRERGPRQGSTWGPH